MMKLRVVLLLALALSRGRVQVCRAGEWVTHGPDRGWVTSLVTDSASPGTVYAGTFSGGILKTSNAGESWTRLDCGPQDSGGTWMLAIDPKGPATLYATDRDGPLLKSSDGGASWERLALGPPGTTVLALAFGPTGSGTIYAGTDRGLFNSTTDGLSWAAADVGISEVRISSVVVDPTIPSTVYAGSALGMFKSTDTGVSWTVVGNEVTNFFGFDPGSPGSLWASIDGELKRTDDGANTWSSTGVRTSALAFDTTTAGTIYAAAPDGVARSTDGGSTWEALGAGLTNAYVHALAVERESLAGEVAVYAGTYAGVFKFTGDTGWRSVNAGFRATSISSLVADPSRPGTVYAADGGGVFRTDTGGATWYTMDEGLGSVAVDALAIDPRSPAHLYSGTHGGVFRRMPGNLGGVWGSRRLQGQVVSMLSFDAASPRIMYAGAQLRGMYKSVDAGESWFPVNSGLPTGDVRALAAHPSTPGTVYAGTHGQGLYKTLDGGGSWSAVNAGLEDISVYSIGLDPRDPETAYAGTLSHGVFKTTTGGATWTATGLSQQWVLALAFDPVRDSTVFAATNGSGVFRTVDGGGSWERINTGLTELQVQSLIAVPGNPAVTLFAGTIGGGVFVYGSTGSSTPTTTIPPCDYHNTTTTLRCVGSDPDGVGCILDQMSLAALCASDPFDEQFARDFGERIRRARDLLSTLASGGPPKTANRIRRRVVRRLDAIVRSAKRAARRDRNPPAISGECKRAIVAAIAEVRQLVRGLRR